MKKIFAMLAIAALATTLMTACGDNNETADNTYKIEKKSNAWEAAALEAFNYNEYITLNAHSADNKVMVHGYLQTAPGSYTYVTSNEDCMEYYDDNDIFVDTEGLIGDAGDAYYNDYVYEESFNETINAFDLTALTIDGNWNEKATDIMSAFAAYDAENEEVIWANISSDKLYDLKGTMKNIHWDAWSTAKDNNAKTARTGFVATKVK